MSSSNYMIASGDGTHVTDDCPRCAIRLLRLCFLSFNSRVLSDQSFLWTIAAPLI
jgi:hypothetical protein